MAQKSEEKDYKEMYEFYKSFETGMTNERRLTAIHMHKKDPNNDSALQFCIASYICSNERIREALEKDLGENDKAIKISKDILNGVSKGLPETQKKTEKPPKDGHFTKKENKKKSQNSPGLSTIN